MTHECTYYGGYYDSNIKPKYPVVYFMLEIFIKDLIEKEIKAHIEQFTKSQKRSFADMEKSILCKISKEKKKKSPDTIIKKIMKID